MYLYRYWAFVEKATDDIKEIHRILDPEHYSTETRGERTVGAARPAGEGFYGIIPHEKGHTHLVYFLELPHGNSSLINQSISIQQTNQSTNRYHCTTFSLLIILSILIYIFVINRSSSIYLIYLSIYLSTQNWAKSKTHSISRKRAAIS